MITEKKKEKENHMVIKNKIKSLKVEKENQENA